MTSTRSLLKEKIFLKYRKDSWEVRNLGEIATEIISGSEITRDQLGSGNHPAIKCGDINSSLPPQFEECISFVDLNLIKKPKFFEKGDILISNMSNKVETIGTAVVYLGNDKCLAGDHVIVLKSNQNSKFLTYALSSDFPRSQIEKLSQKSTVYDLYLSKIKQIQIPLPPPEIQQQIVEFLDRFMKLERELERELERRKIQYEYYKNLIFNRGISEKKWELKSLEEIATEIISGSEITKEQLNSGKTPAIKYIGKSTPPQITNGEDFVNPDLIKKKKFCEKGDILFAKFNRIQKIAGKSTVYLGEEKCLVGAGVIVLKHNQNPKYLSYCLSTDNVRKQMDSILQESIVFQLYPKNLKQIQIPLPPLKIQNEVVEQLDKLYRIINDIKEGIPMLIQKNKEQYNYYKELLLKK